MDKHLKLIILLAVCIILCNQLVHLYQLYKVEKIQYTHRQNELINGTIYEFNMKCPASENTLSFNAFTNKLIYIINHKKTSFQSPIMDVKKLLLLFTGETRFHTNKDALSTIGYPRQYRTNNGFLPGTSCNFTFIPRISGTSRFYLR